MSATSKLSRFQYQILTALREAARGAGSPTALVPYYPLRARLFEAPSRSDQASFSRALVRLEARGLIGRARWYRNDMTGRPVVTRWGCQVQLTEAGLEALDPVNEYHKS